MDKAEYLGTLEWPTAFAPVEEWLRVREVLLSVKQTDDVKMWLAECDRVLAAIRLSFEDPSNLTTDALRLAAGTDERAYQAKLQTVQRLQDQGFDDAIIEEAVNIKLKPEHRQHRG